jgi:cold shock CspA family protein
LNICHLLEVVYKNKYVIEEGNKVTFETEDGKKGPSAVKVQLV